MRNAKVSGRTNEVRNENLSNQVESNQPELEVLYQKMGDRWFAFSVIDDEVYFGSISLSELENATKPIRRVKRISGNT